MGLRVKVRVSASNARCSLAAQDWANPNPNPNPNPNQDWAVGLARARRAEVIAAHDTVEPRASAPLLRTALFLSARAALGMQRFGQAAALTLALTPS